MPRRPDWDTYFLGVADAISVRADCTRRQVGAVVVDPTTKHIVACGYNGSPPGEPGCLSNGACPRGRHYMTFSPTFQKEGCGCGNPSWPCPVAVPPNSSYDTGPGKCISLHAEQNATIRAGTQARGAHMYITDEPCDGCWKLLKGAGYSQITWHGGQWTSEKPGSTLKTWMWKRVLDPIARLLS